MAISTITTFNDLLNSEIISDLILEEARDLTFMPSLILLKDIEGQGSNVYKFPILAALAAAGLTEASDMASTTMSSDASGSITVDEVGVRVDLSDKAAKLTGRIDVDAVIAACGRALATKIETDCCAVFTSASRSVGTTNVDLSLANVDDALYTLKLGKAVFGNPTQPGSPFQGVSVVLQTVQMSNFRTALRQANYSFDPLNALLAEAGKFGSGLAGVYQGMTFWESTLVPASGDDFVGAMFVPRAIGLVTAGGVSVEPQRDASARSTEVNVVQMYGAGESDDLAYVKILSDGA